MNLEKVKAFDLGNYQLSVPEVYTMCHCDEVNYTGSLDAAGLVCLAYKYGFMRGQKAEKRLKKQIPPCNIKIGSPNSNKGSISK